MDFIIDVQGDENLIDQDEVIGEVHENDFEDVDDDTLIEILNKVKIFHNEIITGKERRDAQQKRLHGHKTDEMVDKFFIEMGWGSKLGEKSMPEKELIQKQMHFKFSNINLDTGKFDMKAANVNIDKILEKSVLKPGIEKEHSLPEYDMSDRRQKAIRKREREKTKGPSWYNLPAPEVTEELKNDLQVLKMRSVLDPKHFYKKNDMEVLPKYFQVGKVMDSSLDHYNERLTRKERKRTIVDELLDDAAFNRYNKKKYTEIIEKKKKSQYKTYIKDKRTKSKEQYKKNKRENKLKKQTQQ